VSGPNAGDAFTADGVTEERLLVDTLEWEALRSVVAELRDEQARVKAAPPAPTKARLLDGWRKAIVAMVISLTIGLLAGGVCYALSQSEDAVNIGIIVGVINTAISAISQIGMSFVTGNMAEHIAKNAGQPHPQSTAPPHRPHPQSTAYPPQSWGPR